MENMGSRRDKPAPAASRYPAASYDAWPFRWRTRKQDPERFGQPCRILGSSRPGSQSSTAAFLGWSWASFVQIVVEFEDGTQRTTSRGSIRRRNRT